MPVPRRPVESGTYSSGLVTRGWVVEVFPRQFALRPPGHAAAEGRPLAFFLRRELRFIRGVMGR